MAGNSAQNKRQDSVASPWRDFVNAYKKLEPLSNAILEAEQTARSESQLKSALQKSKDEHEKLKTWYEAELAKRDGLILQCKQLEDSMLDSFGQKYSKLKEESRQSEAEAQKTLIAKDEKKLQEMRSLRSTNKTLSDEVNKHRELHEKSELELDKNLIALTGTTEKLRQAKDKVARLESRIGLSRCSHQQLYAIKFNICLFNTWTNIR